MSRLPGACDYLGLKIARRLRTLNDGTSAYARSGEGRGWVSARRSRRPLVSKREKMSEYFLRRATQSLLYKFASDLKAMFTYLNRMRPDISGN